MKHFLTTTRMATLLLAISALTACKKSDENPKGITWTLDGSDVTAAATTAYTTTSGDLGITGSASKSSTYPQVLLVVPKRTGNSDQSGYTVSGYYLQSSSSGYSAVSGNVTVTQYSTTNVAGTFNLTLNALSGSGTKVISNGKFNVDY